MLPEATAVIKTQHTCCGWVRAAGGSWGTWKWKTQLFLNCRRRIKKQYSAQSFPSPSLSVAHPQPWPCLLPKMTAGFLCEETVLYLRNAEIFRQKWVLHCHTQLVFRCGSYIRTIPHTHLVGYAGGWGVGDPISTWGWNDHAAVLLRSCRTYTPGMEWENPGHAFVSYPWTASMNPSGGDGLGCSSGLGEDLTKHLMGLKSLSSSSHELSWIWQLLTSLLCLKEEIKPEAPVKARDLWGKEKLASGKGQRGNPWCSPCFCSPDVNTSTRAILPQRSRTRWGPDPILTTETRQSLQLLTSLPRCPTNMYPLFSDTIPTGVSCRKNQHELEKPVGSIGKVVYVQGNFWFLWNCRSFKLLTLVWILFFWAYTEHCRY